jgi:hypothetical protein
VTAFVPATLLDARIPSALPRDVLRYVSHDPTTPYWAFTSAPSIRTRLGNGMHGLLDEP